MIRSNTSSIRKVSRGIVDVAFMANIQAFWNWTVRQNPGKSMRRIPFPSKGRLTVSMPRRWTLPHPASLCLRHAGPKLFRSNWFSDRWTRTINTVTRKVSHWLTLDVPFRRIALARKVRPSVTPALAQANRNYFRIGSFRALSQNGEWHFAHTFGLSGLRGHQRCPQRLQRCSSRCGFMDNSILLSSGLVNSQLVLA
jgi:hypothetical protein